MNLKPQAKGSRQRDRAFEIWRELLPSGNEETFKAKSLSRRFERNVDADGSLR